MECFVDIELRPDPELAAHQLIGALYAKLHRVLAAQASTGIAVSFPGYQARPATLGNRMRLLGSQAALQALVSSDWIRGMGDHVKLTAIAAVPPDALHRAMRRVQVKSSPERLRRRLMKRHGLDEQQAADRIPDGAARTLDLPFVQLRSGSTGQTFRMFLSLSPEPQPPTTGDYNSYGLSQSATIPWF